MRANSPVLCLLSYLPKCTAHRGDLCLRASSSSTSQLVTLRDYPWWTQMELNHQVLSGHDWFTASLLRQLPYVRGAVGEIRTPNARFLRPTPLPVGLPLQELVGLSNPLCGPSRHGIPLQHRVTNRSCTCTAPLYIGVALLWPTVTRYALESQSDL